MDAAFVVATSSWVLGELIRVFHQIEIHEAQSIVDNLVQPRVPLVWEGPHSRRVLNPNLSVQSQVLVLLATTPNPVSTAELQQWVECRNTAYFKSILRKLHRNRMIELYPDGKTAELLPPGYSEASGELHSKT